MEFTLSFLLRRITAQNKSLTLIPSPKRITNNTQLYSLQPLCLDFTDINLVLICLCLASSHEGLSVFAVDFGETWISRDKLRPCSMQYREKIPCTPRVLQLRATRMYQTGARANCSSKLCFQITSASIIFRFHLTCVQELPAMGCTGGSHMHLKLKAKHS